MRIRPGVSRRTIPKRVTSSLTGRKPPLKSQYTTCRVASGLPAASAANEADRGDRGRSARRERHRQARRQDRGLLLSGTLPRTSGGAGRHPGRATRTDRRGRGGVERQPGTRPPAAARGRDWSPQIFGGGGAGRATRGAGAGRRARGAGAGRRANGRALQDRGNGDRRRRACRDREPDPRRVDTAIPLMPPRLRGAFHRLRTEGSGSVRETVAVSLGVFIGCLPLYGLHLLICWTVGFALRLNRLKMYLPANVSNPFVAPWLIFAEVQAGAWLRRCSFHPLSRDTITSTGIGVFGM